MKSFWSFPFRRSPEWCKQADSCEKLKCKDNSGEIRKEAVKNKFIQNFSLTP